MARSEGKYLMKEYGNVFWVGTLQPIGGVETFIYSLAREYCDRDLTVLYSSADKEQIRRIAKYVRTVKWNTDPFKCKKLFMNYNTSIIDCVEAEEYIQIVHNDLKAAKINPNTPSKVDRVFAVGENAAKTYTELTGRECGVCHNPLIIEQPKKLLKLISATRLSPEKGAGRMAKLAEALDKAGVMYQWIVFTNEFEKSALKNDHFIYAKSRLDVLPFIADADYLVQLSDFEGVPYSVQEALSVGTGVIVTDLPPMHEIGVKNGVNGFILPLDMSEIPIDQIVKGLKKFSFTPLPTIWDELLGPAPSTYDPETEGLVAVKVIQSYYDTELGMNVSPNTTIYTSVERAKMLKDRGLCCDPDAV